MIWICRLFIMIMKLFIHQRFCWKIMMKSTLWHFFRNFPISFHLFGSVYWLLNHPPFTSSSRNSEVFNFLVSSEYVSTKEDSMAAVIHKLFYITTKYRSTKVSLYYTKLINWQKLKQKTFNLFYPRSPFSFIYLYVIGIMCEFYKVLCSLCFPNDMVYQNFSV